ncbi:MAG: DUF6169 family protein [Chitinophagaceae bacterium]
MLVDRALKEGQKDHHAFDPRIGRTIASIICEYSAIAGRQHMFVFNCDDTDDKQLLRHRHFDRWYRTISRN